LQNLPFIAVAGFFQWTGRDFLHRVKVKVKKAIRCTFIHIWRLRTCGFWVLILWRDGVSGLCMMYQENEEQEEVEKEDLKEAAKGFKYEESSESEEEKRVVRTQKDKRYPADYCTMPWLPYGRAVLCVWCVVCVSLCDINVWNALKCSWELMQNTIKALKNHLKISDFNSVLKDFDALHTQVLYTHSFAIFMCISNSRHGVSCE
jgi:hypothetical protein